MEAQQCKATESMGACKLASSSEKLEVTPGKMPGLPPAVIRHPPYLKYANLRIPFEESANSSPFQQGGGLVNPVA